MNPGIINKIFEIFKSKNPNPQIELNYTNNYTLLVAVVLSARTTDVQVNKAMAPLFKIIKTPKDMLELGENGLIEYVRSIGLYSTKARNVLRLSELLVEHYDSKIPANFEQLRALPGVGNKTAKVVLNYAFDQPVIGVDTHVFRVANRLGFTAKNSVQKVEEDLEKVIPKKWKLGCHRWLVLHGRYVCKARKPLCSQCSVAKYCKHFQNDTFDPPKTKK